MTDETTPDAVAMLQWMHARAVDRENHGDVLVGESEPTHDPDTGEMPLREPGED